MDAAEARELGIALQEQVEAAFRDSEGLLSLSGESLLVCAEASVARYTENQHPATLLYARSLFDLAARLPGVRQSAGIDSLVLQRFFQGIRYHREAILAFTRGSYDCAGMLCRGAYEVCEHVVGVLACNAGEAGFEDFCEMASLNEAAKAMHEGVLSVDPLRDIGKISLRRHGRLRKAIAKKWLQGTSTDALIRMGALLNSHVHLADAGIVHKQRAWLAGHAALQAAYDERHARNVCTHLLIVTWLLLRLLGYISDTSGDAEWLRRYRVVDEVLAQVVEIGSSPELGQAVRELVASCPYLGPHGA